MKFVVIFFLFSDEKHVTEDLRKQETAWGSQYHLIICVISANVCMICLYLLTQSILNRVFISNLRTHFFFEKINIVLSSKGKSKTVSFFFLIQGKKKLDI